MRLRFASHIRLGRGSYIDESAYVHACPGGVEIGDNTYVMHGRYCTRIISAACRLRRPKHHRLTYLADTFSRLSPSGQRRILR